MCSLSGDYTTLFETLLKLSKPRGGKSVKMGILGDSIVVAVKNQVSCDLAGEAAILEMKSGIYYGLNAVGARIWKLIQAPKMVREVCASILEEYDVEAERCEHDILALLEELVATGLVEIRNGTIP
jgi:Coenzyme PQQ synthesis protein D (PqqD)